MYCCVWKKATLPKGVLLFLFLLHACGLNSSRYYHEIMIKKIALSFKSTQLETSK